MLLVVVAVVVAAVLLRGPDRAVVPSGRPSPGASTSPSSATGEAGADTRADRATSLLDRLTAALTSRSRERALALAAPSDAAARRELAELVANVRDLDVDDLSLRYVDEDAGRLSADQQRRLGARAWVGDVQLSWRVHGADRHAARREVTMTFAETRTGAAFVTARSDYGEAAPLWLLERVHVARTGRAVVVTTPGTDGRRFTRLADQAVTDVRKVLPRWRAPLVVEVPRSESQLGHVLGSQEQYGGIAAVTTTADGGGSSGSPVHIFVNPKVFDPLGARGSQIVMSHEATHVATGAATSSMPTWLLEGFADYVALDHVDLPVSATASQILARVRKSGPPKALPGAADFDPESSTLGSTYEAAWLACRLIGEKYGEARLIRFYRASDRAGSTEGPFRDVLGTDEDAFTRAWRASLRRLAG